MLYLYAKGQVLSFKKSTSSSISENSSYFIYAILSNFFFENVNKLGSTGYFYCLKNMITVQVEVFYHLRQNKQDST